jgi:signal transduction histidine kinase
MGMLSTFILFRNYQHRQKVKTMAFRTQADRRIIDMERRILSSVIETENRERKRFSADLHDSLGPLLSSAKLYLGEMAETSTGEQLELTNYTRDIVDSALKNAREISNNIIPASLSEMGLFGSLRSFCEKIERIKAIHFSLDFSQNDYMQLNPGLEVVLYRVLTELINNTVKHAEAKNVHISFTEKNGFLDITYNDNGKGFEVEQTLEKSDRGMGLNNMKSRIEALHGNIQIKSVKDVGTDIEIQVPV